MKNRKRETVEATEQRKATFGGGRRGKGLTQGEQPTGGRGSDTEPIYHVDPIAGCAPGRGRVQTACLLTFDPREEILCRCGGRGDTVSMLTPPTTKA
jgi:hypothetical protein